MGRNYTGTTEEAGAAILGAGFWKKGTTLRGIYVRTFVTVNGDCHQFLCYAPPTIEIPVDGAGRFSAQGEKLATIDRFSIGALTGFEMAVDAMRAHGFNGFQQRDVVTIECTGIQESDTPTRSGMPTFRVSVSDH